MASPRAAEEAAAQQEAPQLTFDDLTDDVLEEVFTSLDVEDKCVGSRSAS